MNHVRSHLFLCWPSSVTIWKGDYYATAAANQASAPPTQAEHNIGCRDDVPSRTTVVHLRYMSRFFTTCTGNSCLLDFSILKKKNYGTSRERLSQSQPTVSLSSRSCYRYRRQLKCELSLLFAFEDDEHGRVCGYGATQNQEVEEFIGRSASDVSWQRATGWLRCKNIAFQYRSIFFDLAFQTYFRSLTGLRRGTCLLSVVSTLPDARLRAGVYVFCGNCFKPVFQYAYLSTLRLVIGLRHTNLTICPCLTPFWSCKN